MNKEKFWSGSGVRKLSGWITAFAVFNKDEKWQGDEIRSMYGISDGDWPVIVLSNVPSGAISVSTS